MVNLENLAIELLKRFAKIAKGRTFMNIKITSVTNDIIVEEYAEPYPEILVDATLFLLEKDFLINGTSRDEYKITWDGINYILNLPNENRPQYGMLSQNELESDYPYVEKEIIERYRKNPNSILSFSEIKEKFNYLGVGPILQILEELRKKNIINFLDDENNRFQLNKP